MNDQKPWEVAEESAASEPKPENREPRYEVVRKFSFGRGRGSRKIQPGDDVPKGISAAAIESLLKKGVLKVLEE